MDSLWYLPFLVAAIISLSTKPAHIISSLLLRNHLSVKKYGANLINEFIEVSYYMICQYSFFLALLLSGVTGVSLSYNKRYILAFVIVLFVLGIYFQLFLYEIGPYDLQKTKKIPFLKAKINYATLFVILNFILQCLLLITGYIAKIE